MAESVSSALTEPERQSSLTTTLGILDIVLTVASLLVSVLVGIYFSNKNKSVDSYMRANGQLSVWPVAVSLMTSAVSGLTLLGASSELYYQGPGFAFMAFAMLLAGPITAYTILPIFYRMNELSLYKYLEYRYGLIVKYFVTIIYVLQMVFYNAVVMYIPAMALQTTLGISKHYSILLMGIICIAYSSIGGVKAVVWTDFFQAFLMYAAVFIVAVLGIFEAGGLGRLFELAQEGGRLSLNDFFNVDLTTRHTIFNILIGATILQINILGVNQVQIQRALSLNSLAKAKRAFVLCSLFTFCISAISSFTGLVIYQAYRSCDPYLAHEIAKRDALVVHYVDRHLGIIPGLRGIFIAGIFSSTLSTLSSFSNSMAALSLNDFVIPLRCYFKCSELSASVSTYVAKLASLAFGVICILVAYLTEKANSRLLQAIITLEAAVGTPFLAAFALGIFTRFVNTTGIIFSFVVTITFGIYIAIDQTFIEAPLEPSMPIRYNEQCSSLFNMSISSDSLETLLFSPAQTIQTPSTPFRVSQISYMMLCVIQFALTVLVGSIVSLLTGGWNQEVDDKYLVSFMRRSTEENRFDHELDGMCTREEMYSEELKSRKSLFVLNKSAVS